MSGQYEKTARIQSGDWQAAAKSAEKPNINDAELQRGAAALASIMMVMAQSNRTVPNTNDVRGLDIIRSTLNRVHAQELQGASPTGFTGSEDQFKAETDPKLAAVREALEI